MPDLIDRDALKSELCSGCSTRCVTVCETIRIINKQPTIKAKPMMLRNCQKYPDRYQIRNGESEVLEDEKC